MATEELYLEVVSTLELEISSSNEALESDAYHRFQSNLMSLKSAYIEGYNDHVKDVMEAFDQLLKEIDNICPIPKTLKAFKKYWEAAKA